MPEKMPREHVMTAEEARRRLSELRMREERGELTVHEAGEITKLLVILGEEQTGQKAA